MTEKKIAIIMTCHNRKERTLRCIHSLNAANQLLNYEIVYYVCDDGSTDGTYKALHSLGDNVHIVLGTGNLFWARGMGRAMEEAEKSNANFFLMVNDDVDFFPDSLQIIMNAYYSLGDEMLAVVGSTKDPMSDNYTYGGSRWKGKAFHSETEPVPPQGTCIECDQTNWNCFLLPRTLYNVIGKIDTKYEHSWADYDYSNRIRLSGYGIYVAPAYIGACSRNSVAGTWGDTSLSIAERFKAMNKRNGLPLMSNWHYHLKFYGIRGIWLVVRPYLSIIKSRLMRRKE